MKQQTLAACLVAVLSLSHAVFSASSFVRCNDIIECAAYNDDPKVGGIRRCKPRKTSTMACSSDYCCSYDTGSNSENTDDTDDSDNTDDSSSSENTDDNSGTETENTENTENTDTSTENTENTDSTDSGEVEVESVDNSDDGSYFIDFTDTTETAIAADVVPLVIASGANDNTGDSFVRCNTAVSCSYYKVDNKKGGVMRCKPRAGSTQSCTSDTCCASAPPTIAADATPTASSTVARCSKVIKSCKTYFSDPVDKGVLRCQRVKGLSTTCSKKFCCKSNSAQADNVPTTTVRCDTVVSCSKFKTDSSDGGSRKCKVGQGYTGAGACSTGYCCATNINPQPDKISTTAKKTTTVVPKPDATSVPSSFVLCSDVVLCNAYYTDPKTKGMLRCKPRAGSTMSCGSAFCCAN